MATQVAVVDPYRSTRKLIWCDGCKRWIANPWAHAGCVPAPPLDLARRYTGRGAKVKVVKLSPHTRRAMYTCVLECGHKVYRSRWHVKRHRPTAVWCKECP